MKLSKFEGDLLTDPTEYRQVVGALQYCTLTRPEISFSINQFCQNMQALTSAHWSAAKRVLLYLKSSVDHSLYNQKGPLHLTAYSDSDWVGDPDDRRSTTGFAIFLGYNLVAWSAKKQSIVSHSSTKAEYRALAITTIEMFWLGMLFKDIHVVLPTTSTIWCDNIGALALAANPVYQTQNKYIEVYYHFVHEKVLNQNIIINFISTDEQVANVFTKGLGSAQFLYLRLKLMMIPSPMSLWGVVRENIVVAKNTASNSPYSAKGNHDHNLQYSAAAEIVESNRDAQAIAKAINYNGQETSQSPKSCSSASLDRRHTRKGLP